VQHDGVLLQFDVFGALLLEPSQTPSIELKQLKRVAKWEKNKQKVMKEVK